MKHLCHLFMFSIALIVGTSPAQGGPALTTTLLGSNETPPNASTQLATPWLHWRAATIPSTWLKASSV